MIAFMRAVQAVKEGEEERARARADAVLSRMSELEIERARALGMGADARYQTVDAQQKRCALSRPHLGPYLAPI